MRTIFPRQVREYEQKYGIRFLGWYNVAHGWDFDNVILLDLPDYATLDKLEADEGARALGARAGELPGLGRRAFPAVPRGQLVRDSADRRADPDRRGSRLPVDRPGPDLPQPEPLSRRC